MKQFTREAAPKKHVFKVNSDIITGFWGVELHPNSLTDAKIVEALRVLREHQYEISTGLNREQAMALAQKMTKEVIGGSSSANVQIR